MYNAQNFALNETDIQWCVLHMDTRNHATFFGGFHCLLHQFHRLLFPKQNKPAGHLLVILNKEANTSNELSFYITGKQFQNVVDGVKKLSQERNSPNIALVLVHYLKQIALIKYSMGIQSDNKDIQREPKHFRVLFDADWNSKISHVANRRNKLRQINKSSMLPNTEDIMKAKEHLIVKMNEGIANSNPNYSEWRDTAKATLCRLVLFNRRRISEIEEMTVDDFEQRVCGDTEKEILETLSQSERALSERYVYM